MRALLSTIAVLAMWGAAIWRLQLRRQGRGERYLSAALIALAATLTFDHPVAEWAVRQVSDVPHLADLVKHVLVLLAGGASTESMRLHMLDEATAGVGRVRRLLATAGCCSLLGILFTVAVHHGLRVKVLMDATAASGYLQAYWAVYIVYMALALVGIARSMTLLARHTEPSPVRVTFTLVAVGAGIAVVYLTHKAALLALDVTHADGGWLRATRNPLSELLILGAVIPFVLGITWQVLARLPVLRHVAAYRALSALYPLWRRLYEATPAVALIQPSIADPRDGDRPGPRDVEHCLQRRVVEIRDGALALRPYIFVAKELTLRAARERNVSPRDIALVAEAAQLELARRAKLSGLPPGDDVHLTATGSTDLAGETRTLRRVAQHLPTVDRIADDLEAHDRLDAT